MHLCMYTMYACAYLLEIFADVINLFHNLAVLNTHILFTHKQMYLIHIYVYYIVYCKGIQTTHTNVQLA